MGVGAVSQVVVISTITVDFGGSDESLLSRMRFAGHTFRLQSIGSPSNAASTSDDSFGRRKSRAWILVLVALEALGVITDVAKTIGRWFHWG